MDLAAKLVAFVFSALSIMMAPGMPAAEGSPAHKWVLLVNSLAGAFAAIFMPAALAKKAPDQKGQATIETFVVTLSGFAGAVLLIWAISLASCTPAQVDAWKKIGTAAVMDCGPTAAKAVELFEELDNDPNSNMTAEQAAIRVAVQVGPAVAACVAVEIWKGRSGLMAEKLSVRAAGWLVDHKAEVTDAYDRAIHPLPAGAYLTNTRAAAIARGAFIDMGYLP